MNFNILSYDDYVTFHRADIDLWCRWCGCIFNAKQFDEHIHLQSKYKTSIKNPDFIYKKFNVTSDYDFSVYFFDGQHVPMGVYCGVQSNRLYLTEKQKQKYGLIEHGLCMQKLYEGKCKYHDLDTWNLQTYKNDPVKTNDERILLFREKYHSKKISKPKSTKEKQD